jgi:hypothetical protein
MSVLLTRDRDPALPSGTLHRALPFKQRMERGMDKQVKIELIVLAIGSVAPAAVATLMVLIH